MLSWQVQGPSTHASSRSQTPISSDPSDFEALKPGHFQVHLGTSNCHSGDLQQGNNIGVGTMILLKDEKAPPLKWNLGRIVNIVEGPYGDIRVVTFHIEDECFDQGISKVCLLPFRDNEESNQLSSV